MLHDAVAQVYRMDIPHEALADSFHDFHALHRLFLSPHGGKRALVWAAERLVLHKPGYGLSHMTPARRPADGFATKYLDDEDGEAGKPEKLSEKAAEIADETAADDAYRQALESFGKEKAEYGSEYDTSYSSVAADYSIYLEDGEEDESDEK